MHGHVVFFALEDSSPDARERLLEACREHLSEHPGTVSFSVGARAQDMQRDVNDAAFDVALQITFESRAAHDAYQAHPRHDAFIAEMQSNWKTVRVFDYEG